MDTRSLSFIFSCSPLDFLHSQNTADLFYEFDVDLSQYPAKRVEYPDCRADIRAICKMQPAICLPETEILFKIVLKRGFMQNIPLPIADIAAVCKPFFKVHQHLIDQRRIYLIPFIFRNGFLNTQVDITPAIIQISITAQLPRFSMKRAIRNAIPFLYILCKAVKRQGDKTRDTPQTPLFAPRAVLPHSPPVQFS